MIDLDVEIYQHLNEQIKINKLCYLSSGDDSDTFLCNEQYVVKVPKRDSVRFAQKREFELYRFLENSYANNRAQVIKKQLPIIDNCNYDLQTGFRQLN